MDSLESQLLALLRENARIPVSELAVLTGQSEAVVAKSVAKLEKTGAIVQYTTVINDELVSGRNVIRALIEVRVHPQKKSGFDRIAKRICRYPEVIDHYLLSGGYDFLIVVEGNSLQAVSAFVANKLASIEHVVTTTTHFMMKKYKENGVILGETVNSDRLAVSP